MEWGECNGKLRKTNERCFTEIAIRKVDLRGMCRIPPSWRWAFICCLVPVPCKLDCLEGFIRCFQTPPVLFSGLGESPEVKQRCVRCVPRGGERQGSLMVHGSVYHSCGCRGEWGDVIKSAKPSAEGQESRIYPVFTVLTLFRVSRYSTGESCSSWKNSSWIKKSQKT